MNTFMRCFVNPFVVYTFVLTCFMTQAAVIKYLFQSNPIQIQVPLCVPATIYHMVRS